MTHVAYGSELRSVVRSSMHPCPGNWVAIWCAVVYYARAARLFTAGIKCQHCKKELNLLVLYCVTAIYAITVDFQNEGGNISAITNTKVIQ